MSNLYPAKPCLHCHRVACLKARGLCGKCWRNPAIVCGYEPLTTVNSYRSSAGLSGHGHGAPTTTRPGAGKVEELAARAQAGLLLFNPGDALADLE